LLDAAKQLLIVDDNVDEERLPGQHLASQTTQDAPGVEIISGRQTERRCICIQSCMPLIPYLATGVT
jgi:hypothetical protein